MPLRIPKKTTKTMADYPRAGEFSAPIYDVRPRGYALRQGAQGGQGSPYPHRAMQSRYPGYVPARPAGGGAFAPAAAAPLEGAPPGGHYGPADYDYPVHGEESGYKEPREEPERTPFFRKRMSIFEFWQLFVMWMAVTGLLVYIAGLIGFHHMLLPGGAGSLHGPCDPFTPCKDETICVENICRCGPGKEAVDNVCVAASNRTTESL